MEKINKIIKLIAVVFVLKKRLLITLCMLGFTVILANLSHQKYSLNNKNYFLNNNTLKTFTSLYHTKYVNTSLNRSLIPLENTLIYRASQQSGIIGAIDEYNLDYIEDNFFSITIPSISSFNDKAFLEYDLYGLEDHHSVSRSINRNISLGGKLIEFSSKWSSQSEQINPKLLHSGENEIRFSASQIGIKYRIKNVRIRIEKNVKSPNEVIITSKSINDKIYLKGFTPNFNQTLTISGDELKSYNTEFEKIIETDHKINNIEIEIDKIKKSFPVNNNIGHKVFQNTDDHDVAMYSFSFSGSENYVQLGSCFILNDTKNVHNKVKLLHLRYKDFPSPVGSVKNITPSNRAFRIDVDNEIKDFIQLKIPFDRKKLSSTTKTNIKVFYFDYVKKTWLAISPIDVDLVNSLITFRTAKNGDFIAGYIVAPESTELSVSDPTKIRNLQTGNPTSGVQIMNVPTANQKGAAEISYPIKVPSGIGGLQPNLSITYNSDGENSWMGEGWSLSGLSTISLDTRWGTPDFNPSVESELYSIDGEMLMFPNNYLPHRHNEVSESDPTLTTNRQLRSEFTTNGNKLFFYRRNHDFSKIERIGSTPDTYSWVVTSPNGSKKYYGGSPASTLRLSNGNIAQWALNKIVDIHGNSINFYYETVATNDGTYFHIQRITYGLREEYSINFIRSKTFIRKDIRFDARLGLRKAEPYVLGEIRVDYKDQNIRTYKFDYTQGEFSKTLLKKIFIIPNNPCSQEPLNKNNSPTDDTSPSGSDSPNSLSTNIATNKIDDNVPGGTPGGGGNPGNGGLEENQCTEIADAYEFNYYNDVGNGTTKKYYTNSTIVFPGIDKTPYSSMVRAVVNPSFLNTNVTIEKGFSGRFGGGISIIPIWFAYVGLGAGGFFGFSQAEAYQTQKFMDFNGDGIPDLLHRIEKDGLYLQLGSLDNRGTLTLKPSKKILNYTNDFSYSKTRSTNTGFDVTVGTTSVSTSHASTTITNSNYLIDANQDGLVDIAADGKIWFNVHDKERESTEMTTFSEFSENMVVKPKKKGIQPPLPLPCVPDPKGYCITNLAMTTPNDVVKVWIAPVEGLIRFEDNIQLVSASTPKATDRSYYSVEILDPTGNSTNSLTGRIYLKELKPNQPIENVKISRYNDYASQLSQIPTDIWNTVGAINSSNYLHVNAGDKVFVRLIKNSEDNLHVNSNPIIYYVDDRGQSVANTNEMCTGSFYLNNGNYGQNFFLNNTSNGILLDGNGTAKITIPSITLPPLPDKIKFKVTTTTTNNGSNNNNQQSPIVTDIIPLEEYDNLNRTTIPHTVSIPVTSANPVTLQFIVESDSDVDLSISNWNGKIDVNFTGTSNTGISADFIVKAIPKYPASTILHLKPKIPLNSIRSNSQQVSVIHAGLSVHSLPSLSGLGSGTFNYIVKKNSIILGKRKVIINGANNTITEEDIDRPGIYINTGIKVWEGISGSHYNSSDKIEIEVYTPTESSYHLYKAYCEAIGSVISNQPIKPFYLQDVNNGTPLIDYVDATSVHSGMFNLKSAVYKNWGQFIYTSPSSQNYQFGSPIDPNTFRISNNNSLLPIQCSSATTQAELDACMSQYGNRQDNVILLRPFIDDQTQSHLWINNSLKQYSNVTGFRDDEANNIAFSPIGTMPPNSPITYTSGQLGLDSTMPSVPNITLSQSRSVIRASGIPLFTESDMTTHLEGIGTVQTQGFIDLNADGYPDVINPDTVKYTNALGSFNAQSALSGSGEPLRSDSKQSVNTIGLLFNHHMIPRDGATGKTATTTRSISAQPWSAGLSLDTNYRDSYDLGNTYWLDINGDGLPDKISGGGTPTMKYALNMGNSLASPVEFPGLITYKSRPVKGSSLGVSAGLAGAMNVGNLGQLGFGVNLSIGGSQISSTGEVLFEDINGDGLKDIITLNQQRAINTYVSLNMGNGFSAPFELRDSDSINMSDEALSSNGGITIGPDVTISWPIFPPFPIFLYFSAQASANFGLNVTENIKEFLDVNGDGYLDIVESSGQNMKVRYSTIGRTNKLSTITNSFTKGQYIIDYSLIRSNYDNPNGKYVVSSVTINNPDAFSVDYTTERGIIKVSKYTFEDGRYSRREREFFGYAAVTEQEIAGGSQKVYRSEYFNTSYHLAGLLKKTSIGEFGTNLSETIYTYNLKKFIDNAAKIDINSNLPANFDTGGREGRRMATALLMQKQVIDREFSGNSITKTESFNYNDKGLIIRYLYQSPSSSYNAVLDYTTLYNSITNIPNLIQVYSGTTTRRLLRYRKAENINLSNGDVGKFSVSDGTNMISTDFTYDWFGNINQVSYPPNENGQRYSISYTYDPQSFKYVTGVTDSFGLTSTATYNPLFDVLTKATDAQGSTSVYYYDGLGRMTRLFAPNEYAGRSLYPTVKYKYWYDHAGIPNSNSKIKLYRARTENLDPQYLATNNNIITDTYADFLGRVIQVKKDAEIDGIERRTVSGKTVFDGLGRVIETFHPVDEALGISNLSLNNNTSSSIKQVYDIRDRVISVTNEDGNTKSISYDVSNNLYQTTETFINHKTETFSNAEGRPVKINNYLNGTALPTTFTYDVLGQLTSSQDPLGLTTTYSYDMAGRKISTHHPDRGNTLFNYDSAGNLIALSTDNLQTDPTIHDHYIRYEYDQNRLVGIKFPELPSGAPNPSNVSYEYGDPNSGFNAGKVISKTEPVATTLYKYGRMGELVAEVQRITDGPNFKYYLKTEYAYDTWNRLTSLKYPDGEKLTYKYDLGGNLKSITNNNNESIVSNITYNDMEQKHTMEYGNTLLHEYSYDAQNKMPVNFRLITSGRIGTEFLNITYGYDQFKNITTISNASQQTPGGMGGAFSNSFSYDTLDRLIGSDNVKYVYVCPRVEDCHWEEEADPNSAQQNRVRMAYNDAGGILIKRQDHFVDQQPVPENTYDNEYEYLSGTHQLAEVRDGRGIQPTTRFKYDLNGNPVTEIKDGSPRQMFWDEQNNLRALWDESLGVFQYNVYDGGAQRRVKYRLDSPGQLYQNGEAIDGAGSLLISEFRIYASPYITLGSSGQYTNHYYAGGQRVASRVKEIRDSYQDADVFYNFNKAGAPSPGKGEAKARNNAEELAGYLKKAGLPTDAGAELREASWDPDLYFLHPDHLGTATFVTNSQGREVQYFRNLPWGETDVEQYNGQYDNPYKFNGKELDEESGLYYYGARYYNPRLSIWYGVDPLAEDYPDFSPYVFSFNNPVRFYDPDGRGPTDIIIRGANNSSVTLKTDLVNISVNASPLGLDFGGNYKLQGEDVLSAGLDIVGILDPSGVADGINAGLQAKKGDWLGATISAVGLIPYAGDVAKVGKIGKDVKIIEKAINAIEEVKALKNLRSSAVRNAWKEEKALIESGAEGTRNWTKAELKELKETGKVKGYQGHHINNVKDHPHQAGDPNNIEFLKGKEHLDAHGGNYRNKTTGDLKNRKTN